MSGLPKNKLYEGQALLLVLLAMSVVLTVALSIVSRSVTDISNSGNQESSARAFAAAEAGVERALVAGNTGSVNLGNSTYNATVSSTGAAISDFNYPIGLSSGDTATIWYVAHDANGNITCGGATPCFAGQATKFCWGNTGAATTPAIEISIYYASTPGDYSTVRVKKIGVDPNGGRGNGFVAPDAGTCTVLGKTYPYQTTLYFINGVFVVPGFNLLDVSNAATFQNGLLFAKVKFLYNTDAQNLGVTLNGIPLVPNNSPLPSQGNNITSAGASGNANRKLQVFQGFDEPPSVFDSAVYTNGGLTK